MPALIVAGCIILALVLVEYDTEIGRNRISGYPRLFGVEPSGSREMLGTVAGSMIKGGGHRVFNRHRRFKSRSDAIHAANFAKLYARSEINQVALGGFVGIFTYCIVVLKTIRGGNDDNVFVPSNAVITGVLLALVGIGFLIYFA